MLKISKKSQYGLRAMVFLAERKNKICSIKEISKKEKIPFNFLEKIFSKLQKAKLIKSKKGMQGGYFLAKDPHKIKVGEIIQSLEEKTFLVDCLKKFCPREKKCLTKSLWKKLNNNIYKTLNSINLSDLIKK